MFKVFNEEFRIIQVDCQMSKKLTYAETGVDRKLRKESKIALEMLKQTHKFSSYGEILKLPFGNIFPIGERRYLDLAIEGVGTKVLLAQLANKYDTIGVDGVAMAVNDVIRSGAKPLAIADNIHTHKSDPALIRELMKGLVRGASESECTVMGGEIGDVAELIKGFEKDKGFDIVISCIGEVDSNHIIFGCEVKPDDVVIGLKSSGLHSNGVTLAKRVLFKEWGGRFDPYDVPESIGKEIILEALEPTKIYTRPLLEVAKKLRIKGAVHITGDAYLKFSRFEEFSKGIGFEFNNFKPQPIFELIQETAKSFGGIADDEMLKTFNMGWGFALIMNGKDEDDVLSILEKNKVEAEPIGKATSTKEIVAIYKHRKLILK